MAPPHPPPRHEPTAYKCFNNIFKKLSIFFIILLTCVIGTHVNKCVNVYDRDAQDMGIDLLLDFFIDLLFRFQRLKYQTIYLMFQLLQLIAIHFSQALSRG